MTYLKIFEPNSNDNTLSLLKKRCLHSSQLQFISSNRVKNLNFKVFMIKELKTKTEQSL